MRQGNFFAVEVCHGACRRIRHIVRPGWASVRHATGREWWSRFRGVLNATTVSALSPRNSSSDQLPRTLAKRRCPRKPLPPGWREANFPASPATFHSRSISPLPGGAC